MYNTGGDLIFWSSGAVGLKIAATSGAATFSSSVTAQSLDVISSSGVGSSSASGLARFITAGTTTAISIGQSTAARRMDIGNYYISVTGEQFELTTASSQPLIFSTNSTERMRITSGGNVGIGNTNPNSYNSAANALVVGTTSGNNGMTIAAGTTGYSGIYFADGTTGNEAFRGYIEYGHSADALTFGTAASGRLTISSAGAVTINNLGTGTVTASSGVLSTVSDSSFKIEDGFIEDALPSVMNLKPRYFYWKDKSGLDTTIRQLGFYAQEVNSAIGEEAANTPKKDSPWGINDRSVIAMLTKAIQEQQAQIKDLQTEIQTLKNK